MPMILCERYVSLWTSNNRRQCGTNAHLVLGRYPLSTNILLVRTVAVCAPKSALLFSRIRPLNVRRHAPSDDDVDDDDDDDDENDDVDEL